MFSHIYRIVIDGIETDIKRNDINNRIEDEESAKNGNERFFKILIL